MALSPNEKTEEWITKAPKSDLESMIYHMISGSIEAAILAYQYASSN